MVRMSPRRISTLGKIGISTWLRTILRRKTPCANGRLADFADRLAAVSFAANQHVDFFDRQILKFAVGDFREQGVELLDENVALAR